MSKKSKKLTAADVIGFTGSYVLPIKTTTKGTRFKVKVRILELRPMFGRQDLRVTPVEGEGESFVSSEHIEDIKNPNLD